MSQTKISVDEFQAAIAAELEKYGKDAEWAIERAVIKTAKDLSKELRAGGGYQVRAVGKRYNAGWTSDHTNKRLGTSADIYNKNIPGLAHLLEFGHAIKGGGRTRAFPHIAPVEAKADETVLKEFQIYLSKATGG